MPPVEVITIELFCSEIVRFCTMECVRVIKCTLYKKGIKESENKSMETTVGNRFQDWGKTRAEGSVSL